MIKITNTEIEFMNIIWENAPVNSTELVKLANEKFGWKKSTTYTVIKNLTVKQVLVSKNAIVSPLVTREEVAVSVSENNFNNVYGGSINLFLTSFLKKEKLTKEQAIELKKIIDKNVIGEE